MRAYLPVRWDQLAELDASGQLPGPLPAGTVDPQWRAGAPEVDEEEWEFEAQAMAAAALADMGGGVVLAVDLPDAAGLVAADGWVTAPGPISRTDVAAVLTADLAWFGVQEIADLLAGR